MRTTSKTFVSQEAKKEAPSNNRIVRATTGCFCFFLFILEPESAPESHLQYSSLAEKMEGKQVWEHVDQGWCSGLALCLGPYKLPIVSVKFQEAGLAQLGERQTEVNFGKIQYLKVMCSIHINRN